MQSQQDKNQQQVQKKQQQFIYKISYVDDPDGIQPKKYKYSHDTLFPFLFFYKLLALKPCDRNHKYFLTLNIPDTIVFNDGDNPVMWFYTNDKGQVVRMDNVPYYLITSKISQGAFDKQLVAVLKKPSYSGYGGPSGNQIKVISASQVKTVISIVLSSRNQTSVIQKFVKSGSIKPSIVRTCWRASGPHQSWTINSNYEYNSRAKVPEISKFVVNTKFPKGFRAIKNVSEKYTNQTLKYVKNIVQFVSRHLKIKFLEFVCDFIKDQAGNWWFINVKAFILQKQQKINIRPITMHDDDAPEEQRVKKNIQSYTKCKKCKYCYKIISQHLMTHKLTLMMILQCDQNLIRMGKNFPWLDRCYRHHVNSVNLYVQYKVCDSCYKLYTQVQKIMNLSQKMAKITGVNLKNDNKNLVSITGIPAFKGQSPQFGSRFQKLKYDKQMPQNWSLPTDQKIKVGLQGQRNYNINRCKFMIFVHGIRDIPKIFGNSTKKYYLQYNFLDNEVRYQLDLNFTEQYEDMLRLKLDKMKIIYFFSQSREDIIKFLKNQQKLKVSLYQDNQVMGYLELQLNDFKSDKVIKKDYYKMFSGAKVFPFLSWGLFISLGLHEDAKIDTKSLKLVRKNNLLIPQVGYHCPDLLPQQWIQMINEKTDSIKTLVSLPSESGEISAYQNNSQLQIKYKIETQMSNYSRRKVFSQQKNRRRVYY